jgi:hypothetical protein
VNADRFGLPIAALTADLHKSVLAAMTALMTAV